MIYFEFYDLKPISRQVLEFLYNNPPMRSSEIASHLGLKQRQIDACITKSLVRYGFANRQAHLTRLMKKEYNLIAITDLGKRYVDWLKKERTF